MTQWQSSTNHSLLVHRNLDRVLVRWAWRKFRFVPRLPSVTLRPPINITCPNSEMISSSIKAHLAGFFRYDDSDILVNPA